MTVNLPAMRKLTKLARILKGHAERCNETVLRETWIREGFEIAAERIEDIIRELRK